MRRFKRTIHVVDSTTIKWLASRVDWARYRRRKATAKCHLQACCRRFAIGADTARRI